MDCSKKCINKKRQHNKKRWTTEEDDKLIRLVREIGSQWLNISLLMQQRTPSQCSQRWKMIGKQHKMIYKSKKQQLWTVEEDETIKSAMKIHSTNWTQLQVLIPNRTPHQIRERYINHLDHSLDKSQWTDQEDQVIWNWVQSNGTKWSALSKILKNRSQNSLKNRYYGFVRSKYGNQINPYYILPISSKQINQDEEEIISQYCEQDELNQPNDYSLVVFPNHPQIKLY